MEMVSKKYYYDIDLRGNRLLNFAVESVSGELPSEANEGAVIYHSGEGVMYQRLKDGWKVIASGKDLEDALSKVSEDLQALSRDTEEALGTKADKTTVTSLSNALTKEIQDRQAGDTTNAAAISTHVANKSNPHGVTKAQVGLGNVDNTSDVNKPISTAVQNALSGKAGTSVATQSANGLMSSADKKKLDGISSGAQVNVIETVKVNNTALGVSGKAVNIDLSDYAKKGDVTTVMRYKGSVATVSSLPTTATLGDTYNVIDTNANYTWDGSAWDLIGSTVDLSSYATKTEVDSALSGKVSKTGDTMTGRLTMSGASTLYAFNGADVTPISFTNELNGNTSLSFTTNGKRTSMIRSINSDTSKSINLYTFGADGNFSSYGIISCIYNPSANEYYANAPSWSVGTNDNSNKILTIKMANSLPSLCHTTGNETIAGTKTFTSKPIVRKAGYGSMDFINTNANPNTVGNWALMHEIGFYGTDGKNDLKLGGYYISTNGDGDPRTVIQTRRVVNGETKVGELEIRVISDGSAIAYAPQPPQSANYTEIVTANWCNSKFVQKTGDTMTGHLRLQLGDPRIDIVNTRYVRGTAPSGTCYWIAGRFFDNSPTPKTIMSIEGTVLKDERRVYQFAIVSNSNVWSYPVKIVSNPDNSGQYMVCPTPASKSENSTQVATTGWVNQADFLVHTTGNESISGVKTFTANPVIKSNLTLSWQGPPTVENINERITKNFAGFTTVGNFLAKATDGVVGGTNVFRSTPGGYAASITNLIANNAGGTEATISLVARDDGVMYAQAPSTQAGAIGNEIATADWSLAKFVKKSGDTMTGNLSINMELPRLYMGISKEGNYGDIIFSGADGNRAAVVRGIDGVESNNLILATIHPTTGTLNYALNINYDSNNLLNVTAPSWSVGTNDNSDKILTIKMANSLPSLVHTTGNESIAGVKTFTSNIFGPAYVAKSSAQPTPFIDFHYSNASTFTTRFIQLDGEFRITGSVPITLGTSLPSTATGNEIVTANWVNNKLAGKVYISANAPTASDGNDGDIWLQYE